MTRVDDDKDTQFTWLADLRRESQNVKHLEVEFSGVKWTHLSEGGMNSERYLMMDTEHTVDTEQP